MFSFIIYNTLKPRQNRRHFAADIFKLTFLNAIVLISIRVLLNFVPQGPVINNPALIQIMAWRRPGGKPLFAWWRHQMETFSALLAICAGNSPVPVNSPHKGQWRGALMFTLICARINGWVNNREAGDLRRHRCHYDVIVMGAMAVRLSMHICVTRPQWVKCNL